MTIAEQLRSIAHNFDAAEALRQGAIERLVEVAMAMRDGSSIEPIEAAAQVAAGADSGGAGSVEDPASPSAIEQPAAGTGVIPELPLDPGASGAKPARADAPGQGAARSGARSPRTPASAKRAEAVRVERTPADQAGERGSDTHPPLHAFDPLGPELRACLEPGCGRSFTSPHGLQVHRTRAHGRNWSTKPELTEPEKPSKRATAGARLAARDAARAHPRPARSPAPAAGVTRPASLGAAPVIRKGTESWVCNRCPEAFRTREARDLHQEADHDSEPRRLPVGEPQPVFDTSGGGFRD